MKKVVEEFKKVNTEKITSVDEVVKELIGYFDSDYDYSYSDEEEPTSIDEYEDAVRSILEYDLDIEDVSDEELEEIVDKTYSIFVDKLNKFRNEQKDYEKSLFQNRDSIKDKLSEWFRYNEDINFLTLDDIIDLIIENGNK